MERIVCEEKLIELVKESVFLYDKKHKLYKNNAAKANKWREIAEKLQIDESKCRQKWSNLRDQYMRELRKLEGPSGSAAEFKPKWKFCEQLGFLRDSTRPRMTTCNYTDSDLAETSACEESRELASIFAKPIAASSPSLPDLEIEGGNNDKSSQSGPSSSGCTSSKKKRTSSETESDFRAFLDDLRSELTTPVDEIELFFQSAAKLVRDAKLSKAELLDLEIDMLNLIRSKIAK